MANSEAKRAANRRWAAANPEKVKAASAKWRAENREKKRAESRAYRAANVEKMAGLAKAWMARNPGKGAEYAAEWRRRNPEKSRASRQAYCATEKGKLAHRIAAARRRSLKRSAPGTFSRADVLACLALTEWRCFYCLTSLRDGFEVDHMTPLSRGGSNWPDNIVCVCERCNCSKRAKTAAEFILGSPACPPAPSTPSASPRLGTSS